MTIPFPGRAIRALVVIPDTEDSRDYCRVVMGGWPTDFEPDITPGPLWLVLRTARDWGHGLPITVHPECERRAAA